MRRRKKEEAAEAEVAEAAEAAEPRIGPFDFEDLDPDAQYIDLGSMLIQPREGLELRLQVDNDSGEVNAVMLVNEEGILEVRAFANSRGGDLWDEARREIAADTARRGGTATEQEGPFGTELACQVPVTGPDGEALVQPSRVIGQSRGRWFLRATMAGRPVVEPETATVFEDAFRDIVVNRGGGAMAPGEPLPLRLPPEARPENTPAD